MLYPWEMSILDGAHALWLRAKLSIVGDTAITGDLDVSGTITGGTIPIENLSDVDKQSFENLVDNGEFKLWSAGITSAPDNWLLSNATCEQDAVNFKVLKYGAGITPSINSARFYQNISDYERYRGRYITVGAWVKSASTYTMLRLADSVTGVSQHHSGSGNYEWLTATKLIDAATAVVQVQLYPDDTNGTAIAVIDGVMAVEGRICPAFSPRALSNPTTYGEMYIYNNSNTTVIETVDTPIALRQISEGLNSGFIFHAGSTGAITAYADYSGTVTGTVLVTDAGHGLSTGDIITIRGSTNYNGIFAVTVVSVDTFYITDTWVNDNGASDWDQGASLTTQPGADGVYTSTWQMTTAPDGACELCFKVNINETPQNKSTACRDMAINDKDNNSSTCLMSVVEGDIIWLSVQSDSTDDVTNSMGNMNLERL